MDRPRAAREADGGAGELDRDLLHGFGLAMAMPRARGEAGEIAQRRQAVMREGGFRAGIMRDALEHLGREPEREAAVALAVAVRAGETVPGIRPGDSDPSDSSDVPCWSRATKLPESNNATLVVDGQLLGFMVAAARKCRRYPSPPSRRPRHRRDPKFARRAVRRLARERGGERVV